MLLIEASKRFWEAPNPVLNEATDARALSIATNEPLAPVIVVTLTPVDPSLN